MLNYETAQRLLAEAKQKFDSEKNQTAHVVLNYIKDDPENTGILRLTTSSDWKTALGLEDGAGVEQAKSVIRRKVFSRIVKEIDGKMLVPNVSTLDAIIKAVETGENEVKVRKETLTPKTALARLCKIGEDDYTDFTESFKESLAEYMSLRNSRESREKFVAEDLEF